ncbi:MAG: hypothetical protein QNJ65_22030 [Xenococcaceae cyanobacterium MO_234.B1]|nr:hypothetical protein [Xenococcaceae cyanobacterium MO_234.B1]
MSIELLTAEKLLEMALGAIVGGATTEGVTKLWQMIKNRLLKNQPIEAEIVELEQNPTQENLKPLEPFLQVEMYKDKLFAEEISKLAQEIAKAKSGDNIDNITVQEIKAETGGVAAAKIDAPGSRLGGEDTHLHLGK